MNRADLLRRDERRLPQREHQRRPRIPVPRAGVFNGFLQGIRVAAHVVAIVAALKRLELAQATRVRMRPYSRRTHAIWAIIAHTVSSMVSRFTSPSRQCNPMSSSRSHDMTITGPQSHARQS